MEEPTTNERISIQELTILILAVCLIFLFFRKCSSGNDVPVQTVRIDSFWRDTGTHTIKMVQSPIPWKIMHPDPIRIDSFIHDTTFMGDSLLFAAVEDYFSHKYYRDSLNDSNINIVVRYMVNENASHDMAIDYRWKKPLIQYTTLPTPKDRNSLWLMNSIGYGPGVLVGSQLSFMRKKRDMFAIGAMVPFNGNQKIFYFHYGFRIF